jgi:hypothetical protein
VSVVLTGFTGAKSGLAFATELHELLKLGSECGASTTLMGHAMVRIHSYAALCDL